jgi:hypothetical protein
MVFELNAELIQIDYAVLAADPKQLATNFVVGNFRNDDTSLQYGGPQAIAGTRRQAADSAHVRESRAVPRQEEWLLSRDFLARLAGRSPDQIRFSSSALAMS